MRASVNIVCLFGIVTIAMHMIGSFITLRFADNYVLFYIADMAITIFATLVPALAFAYMGRGVRHYLHFKLRRKTGIFDSVLLVLFGMSGCIVANMLITMLSHFLPVSEPNIQIYFSATPGNFCLMVLATALIPSFCEEYACRGYVYSSLSRFGHLYACLFSSLVFGLMHNNLRSALFAFLCGFLFACIRKSSNIFLLSVIVHFLNNTLSAASTFIRMTLGSDFYSNFFTISAQVSLFVFAGTIFLLRKRSIRVFYFSESPYPLSLRDKLLATLTSPVLYLLLFAGTATKLL